MDEHAFLLPGGTGGAGTGAALASNMGLRFHGIAADERRCRGLIQPKNKMQNIAHTIQQTMTALFLAACLVLPASLVHAAKPQTTPVDVTFIDEFLLEYCGLNVEVHVKGTLIVGRRGDMETVSGPWKVTYTNLDNGNSVIVNGPTHGSFVYRPADGELIIDSVVTGPLLIKASNGPLAWIRVGRFVSHVVIDVETGELISDDLLFEAGITPEGDLFDAFDILCGLLSD